MVISLAFWRGRRVLLTGHTGFKGAWTTLLLHRLGAEACGFALPPEHEDGVFRATGAANDLLHRVGNINDLATVKALVAAFRPVRVIGLGFQDAAEQPLGIVDTPGVEVRETLANSFVAGTGARVHLEKVPAGSRWSFDCL
jgi:hypothetical protein